MEAIFVVGGHEAPKTATAVFVPPCPQTAWRIRNKSSRKRKICSRFVAVFVHDTANVGKLEITELGRAQYRLAIPRQLLPGRQKEGLAKLKGLPIALLSGAGELNRKLEEIFKETGAEVKIVAESDTFATLRDLVQTGAVAAILPEWSAKSLPSEAIAVIVLPELKILERMLVIATHGRMSGLRPRIADAIAALREVWRP